MGLEYKGGRASPASIGQGDLPRKIRLMHVWRHLPSATNAKFRIRLAPSSQSRFMIDGEGEDGWVDRPARRISSGQFGTAVRHDLRLSARQPLSADARARFQVRAVAPDDTMTRTLSILVTA